MAAVHAQAWADAAVSVEWVCSPSARGRHFAASIGAKWTSSIDEALDDSRVTIMDVCTPTATHPALIEAGIYAGKHVLAEKPIALDEIGLDRVLEANMSRIPGQILMIAHVVPFFSGYDTILRRVKAGTIGIPGSVVATRFSTTPNWGSWIIDESASGGPVVDLLIHDFDIANRLLGTPTAVTASEYQGCYSVTIRYKNGGTAFVTGGSALPAGIPFSSSLEVAGSGGVIAHRYTASIADATIGNGFVDHLTKSGLERIPVAADDPYLRQIRYFLACLNNGQAPVIGSMISASSALAVSRAALRSLTSGNEERPDVSRVGYNLDTSNEEPS